MRAKIINMIAKFSGLSHSHDMCVPVPDQSLYSYIICLGLFYVQ
jgi:hypothetical protein